MKIIYSLGIRLMYFWIWMASPVNKKARLWIKGRRKIFSRIEKEIRPGDKTIWFHCASLGEFEQARPLIREIVKQYIEYKILITFFSPSGYEVRKSYGAADYVFYLPLDTKKNARKFIQLLNPQKVFFIKYEFWYFFINELAKRQIPVYSVSANFRTNHLFFRRYGKWYRRILKNFTHIFVQNQQSYNLLKKYNINTVTISGDTRFDRVFSIAMQSKSIELVNYFKQNKITIIAGSTHEKDEEFLIRYINYSSNNIKFIIAPHDINEDRINRVYDAIRKYVIKYSEANKNNISEADVLIVDNIGLLSSVYRFGNIAYVGGGFGKGIHNILEHAVYGMPILFGPNYKKSSEAIDLIDQNAAFVITDYQGLEIILNKFCNSKELLTNISRISRNYVRDNKGATGIILKKIKE